MKTSLLLFVVLVVPRIAEAQSCEYPTCTGTPHQAECRTTYTNDYRSPSGNRCFMCSPTQGNCRLDATNDCVSDCRECKAASDGRPWVQEGLYYCATWNGTYEQLCSSCPSNDWANQAVSCDPFYCGAIDGVHCRVRDCSDCH